MSESEKPPSDLEEALLSAVPKDSDVARPVEGPESISEAVQMQIDNIVNQNPDLQKSPDELYETLLKPGLHDAITALGLDSVIQKCKAKLQNAHMGNLARTEKKVTRWLMDAFKTKKIPFKKWAFFPKSIVSEGAVNCSGAALLFGVIMNEELGIQTEQTNPIGHAANLVTFSDGTTHYVDPRNRQSFRLKLDSPIHKRDGFRIYQIDVKGLEYRLLPVSDLKHGAILTMLENINALKESENNDPEARRVMNDHRVDFDFARQYMEGNFLSVREAEKEWQDEEKHKQAVRMRRWYYFLIPNH